MATDSTLEVSMAQHKFIAVAAPKDLTVEIDTQIHSSLLLTVPKKRRCHVQGAIEESPGQSGGRWDRTKRWARAFIVASTRGTGEAG